MSAHLLPSLGQRSTYSDLAKILPVTQGQKTVPFLQHPTTDEDLSVCEEQG